MKNYLLLLLILIAAPATAQHSTLSDTVVVPKQLSLKGVILDKGWKFQAGDNPDYASPGFNDSRWQPIDPRKDIYDLPQLWKGIGWLRLKLLLDSATASKPLALLIHQSGASEIYVNGKLLHRYGSVSTRPGEINAYDPLGKPLPLQFIQPGVNVLAVRYTLQPNVFYTRITIRQNPAFFVTVNSMETAIDSYRLETIRTSGGMLLIGIFLLLLVLHLAFYLYYPAKKANLYFSLFAALHLLSLLIGYNIINEVKYIFYQFNALIDFLQLGNFFLLTAIYSLLNQKRGWIYWSLLVLIIAGIVLNATLYLFGFAISAWLINTLINLEVVRIAYKGIKNKQRGAWLIAMGAICLFVFSCFFLYLASSGTMFMPLGEVYTIGDLIYVILILSIPISTSVYLGLDFAFTSRSLQHKLTEVNKLAERNLAHEQDKQQILATQKENLERQVKERTAALNQSLDELKAAQAQLVQREKMASLGELTAGIAHEIQNPLNFVNNFSEVNTELLEELEQEADNGNIADIKSIVADIKENEHKINLHGKRADAIVKGMLQHSKFNTGTKEPTDINALCDEYLRLSYHGLRAKDKLFNAGLKADFDESIGKINVVPQDIGRVLLNLFNNAFYTVHEQMKKLGAGYEPTVWVSTKKLDDKIEIKVKDNGMGISKSLVDKIFQPFFTTKPTGHGTGLGLSLSYDIIKAHGGEISVMSQEGEGTTFIVQIPVA
jgi:signal transduction histidine kinase